MLTPGAEARTYLKTDLLDLQEIGDAVYQAKSSLPEDEEMNLTGSWAEWGQSP